MNEQTDLSDAVFFLASIVALLLLLSDLLG
jgi:hypothetical protein